MREVARIGPLRIVALVRPGALVAFQDACGDASVVLTATQCRRLATELSMLADGQAVFNVNPCVSEP